MDGTDLKHDVNRPFFQGLVVVTASFAQALNAQAPGMAGYLIPQLTSGNDIIFVSKQTGSWVGKKTPYYICFVYI